ncbi:chlorhexidine efflux transporter [Shigella sp. FC1967]|uniref:chlorhexidine efflux transporter n=1 Tax=Shigella sp. FC1967 TaxID=1898041 RepID=UPI0025707B5D|nr:chlorhexidine efflux transporter [Shigella sp. FC1967]
MWWYHVSFIKAISMEITILVFFFIYTYLFTFAFDKLCPRIYLVKNKSDVMAQSCRYSVGLLLKYWRNA